NSLCLSKLMCKVMGMELVVAKELVFEHARNAFLGAFDDVLSVSNIQPIYHNVFLRAPLKRPQGVSGG
ncbi:hypothetical protein ACSLOY_28670, partial [Klebsiella pneumoniae]